MNQEIIAKITPIFRNALETPDLVLTREMDANQVENWDSLNHISLIIAIEEAFSIEFDTEELIGLATVGEMIDLIETKLRDQ